MTKANTLLKKAALYEKLALYGRRQDFLAALAISPQEVTEATQSAINKLNDASVKLTAINKINHDALPNSATIDQIERQYNMLVAEANKARAQGTTAVYPIMNQLFSAKSDINKSKQWAESQKSLFKETDKPILPEEIGQYTTTFTTEKPATPATDPASVFNFVYAKLQQAYTTNNLKDMMDFLPKLQGAVKKLGGDNPYADDTTQALVQKGTQLISMVQKKLGEA